MVPQDRNFPRVGLLLGAGFAGSFVLALGFAALAEHLARGLRAAHQVEQVLGLPNLAVVPKVKQGRRLGRPHRYVFDCPQSTFAEAIRALVLAIERAAAFQLAKVLVVTSTWQAEGKTTLAICLAAMAARRGRRAVVVDLDLRHPSLARELGVQASVGLLEYLQDQCSLDDVVQTAREEPRLHLIALRGPVANPAEILASPRLRELIMQLRAHYDIVVLDVPPCLGITDAQAVGLLADAALFIVRWGATSSGAALNALEGLARAGVNIIGCALTQVDLRQYALYAYQGADAYNRTYRSYFRG
jgi:capsular exopolysaccharide synthesis family protein